MFTQKKNRVYHLPRHIDFMRLTSGAYKLIPPQGGWQFPLDRIFLFPLVMGLWFGREVLGFYDPRLPGDSVSRTADGNYRLNAGQDTLDFCSAFDALRCLIIEYGTDPWSLKVVKS